jgi:hypothetical protein
MVSIMYEEAEAQKGHYEAALLSVPLASLC